MSSPADYRNGSFKTQIGAIFTSPTGVGGTGQTYISGSSRKLQSVLFSQGQAISTDASFSTRNLAPSKESAGEISVYHADVLGGLCGAEALRFNGSGVSVTGDLSGFAEYNIVVPCTEVTIPTYKGSQPTGGTCFTEGVGTAVRKLGKVVIKNIGSPDLSTKGYANSSGTITVDHRDNPFPVDFGDCIWWGVAHSHENVSDVAQVSESVSKDDAMSDLYCDCSGIPGWYGKAINDDWVPCSSGAYNANPVATGIPDFVTTNKTFLCTDWTIKGKINPGETTVIDFTDDGNYTPAGTGVVLKFVASPGEYTKLANAGLAFGPSELYRDTRQPNARVKIEVYPCNVDG